MNDTQQVADGFGYFGNTLFPDTIILPKMSSGSLMTDMMYQILWDRSLPYYDRLELALYIRRSTFDAIRELLTKHGISLPPSNAAKELLLAEMGKRVYSVEATALIELVAMRYGWLRAAGDMNMFDEFLLYGDPDYLINVHMWCETHGYVRINKGVKHQGNYCIQCHDEEMTALYGWDVEDEEVATMDHGEWDRYEPGNTDDESQYTPRA